jgi:hypothetical protein
MAAPGHLKGVPDVYGTGTGSVGRGAKPPLGDNTAFISGVAAGVVDKEPTGPKPRLSPGESAGARLTVSPSMKVPTESPVPTQGQGRIVPSTPSRQGSFGQGQQEGSWG